VTWFLAIQCNIECQMCHSFIYMIQAFKFNKSFIYSYIYIYTMLLKLTRTRMKCQEMSLSHCLPTCKQFWPLASMGNCLIWLENFNHKHCHSVFQIRRCQKLISWCLGCIWMKSCGQGRLFFCHNMDPSFFLSFFPLYHFGMGEEYHCYLIKFW
jgi:hypothetical protein